MALLRSTCKEKESAERNRRRHEVTAGSCVSPIEKIVADEAAGKNESTTIVRAQTVSLSLSLSLSLFHFSLSFVSMSLRNAPGLVLFADEKSKEGSRGNGNKVE